MGKSKKRRREKGGAEDSSDASGSGSSSDSSSSTERSRERKKSKKHKKEKKHKKSGETAKQMEKRLKKEAKRFLKEQEKKDKQAASSQQLALQPTGGTADAGAAAGWAGWNRKELPGGGGAAELADQEMDRRTADRAAAKREAKLARRREKDELEELAPKATGREARVEARVARREDARAREASPEQLTLPGGGDIMGGGGDSFQAALARQRRADAARTQRQTAKSSVMQERLNAFQQAEDAKMAVFRALIANAGGPDGGRLAIPKRE